MIEEIGVPTTKPSAPSGSSSHERSALHAFLAAVAIMIGST